MNDLKTLAEALLKDSSTGMVVNQKAITGMGGLGKTQLAVEFAYRYGRYYRGVHWLNLADPTLLDSEIALCGMQLTLPNWPADQPSQVILTINTWKADGPRLLILDNFEAVEQVNSVLARLRHSGLHLLITSRHSDWPSTSGLRSLDLGVFKKEESLAFLKKSLDKRTDKDEDLATLAERLGHLPLALELSSRYLNAHPRLSLDEYLTQAKGAFDHPSMKNWRKDLPSPTQHDLDLQRTFALSWEALNTKNTKDTKKKGRWWNKVTSYVMGKSILKLKPERIAKTLFLTAGYLAPNTPIPLEILEKALGISGETCDEALNILYGLGLLRKGENDQPTVHPLLAEYGRGLAKEKQEILLKLADVLGALSIQAIDTGLPSRFIPLRSHMPIVATHAQEANLQVAGLLWNNYGYHLKMIADYSGARYAYERALQIDETAIGLDDSIVAIRVNNLGKVMQDQGDLKGARAMLERALRIFENQFGEDHPQVAIGVSNLGLVMKDQGDFDGARVMFERALKIDETAFGPDHPKVATRVNNLGMVMKDQGNFDGARAMLERALKIFENQFGEDHPQVAAGVNNLGLVMRDQGDFDGARVMFERALRIIENQLGEDHPQVATGFNNLGAVMQNQGDLNGARAMFERALKIDEAAFGPDHPSVAICVSNLGGVMKEQGDLNGARTMYERALKIFKQFLPPDHPNIKIVQENLNSLGE